MAYSTNSDIQSEFKNLTYTSGGISSSEVDNFILEEDAFIDGIVGRKYETPVTGTYSLRILKTISIQLVVSRIKRILAVKTGRPELDQDSSSNLFAMAKTKLDDIAEGRLILSDATLARSSDGVDSFAVSDDIKHIFKRDQDQW
jgi:hypothetical protein